jgi:hypothetical protein
MPLAKPRSSRGKCCVNMDMLGRPYRVSPVKGTGAHTLAEERGKRQTASNWFGAKTTSE